MKKMKEKANITERKKLTNTSSRKYLIQKLRDKNIPPTDIMQISGHRNVQSINSYSNISDKQQQTYSNYLSNTGHPSNDAVIPHPHNKEISNCTATDCSISSSQTCNIQQNQIISNPFYGSNITVQNMFVMNLPQNVNEIPNWVNFLQQATSQTGPTQQKRRRIIESDTDSQ